MPQGGGAESYSARSYTSGDEYGGASGGPSTPSHGGDRSYASADEYGGYNQAYASADEHKQTGSASARSYASADESFRHTDNSARSYASADEYKYGGESARSYTSGEEYSTHRSRHAGGASYTSDHDYQSGGGYNSGGGGSGYSSANEYVAYDGGGGNNVLPFVPQTTAEAKSSYGDAENEYKDQRVDDQVVEDVFSLARHGKITEVNMIKLV